MNILNFSAELVIEELDEGVVGRFARPGGIERDSELVRPQIKMVRHNRAVWLPGNVRSFSETLPCAVRHASHRFDPGDRPDVAR
jgi:hypothetical protein